MDSSFNLAVHALVCMSHSGRSLSSEALAENICTNPTRVRRVLAVRTGDSGSYRYHRRYCEPDQPAVIKCQY